MSDYITVHQLEKQAPAALGLRKITNGDPYRTTSVTEILNYYYYYSSFI